MKSISVAFEIEVFGARGLAATIAAGMPLPHNIVVLLYRDLIKPNT